MESCEGGRMAVLGLPSERRALWICMMCCEAPLDNTHITHDELQHPSRYFSSSANGARACEISTKIRRTEYQKEAYGYHELTEIRM